LVQISGIQTPSIDNGQNITTQKVENRTKVLEGQDGTKFKPEDIPNIGEDKLTSAVIAEELSKLSPNEIIDYPLDELSSNDIEDTLNLLSDDDLEKILINLDPDNLQMLFLKIGHSFKDSLLERVNPNVQERVSDIIGTLN
jgi:hypothetical protein